MMAVAMPSWMERGVASQVMPMELQLVSSRLLLLVAAALLPLLQHQNEEEAEAGRHHHPVHRACRLMSVARNNMSSSWLNGTVQYSRKKAKFWWNEEKTLLMSCWKLIQVWSSSSLLSDACTLAGRMLGREDPCGRDNSWCCPSTFTLCFLLCWGGCIDGSRDGRACLCGWGRSSTLFSVFTLMFTLENLNQSGSGVNRRRVHKLVSWPFPYPDEWLVVMLSLSNIIHKKYN